VAIALFSLGTLLVPSIRTLTRTDAPSIEDAQVATPTT
jgi:hypothetical protein